jgi:hypothetical protein
MAEMRHPMDFWKGMILAQSFICFVYILFGAFVSVLPLPNMPVDRSGRKIRANHVFIQVYGHYGQYAIANIVNVIQPLSLQTASNVLALLTATVACCKCPSCLLYFHISNSCVQYCTSISA